MYREPIKFLRWSDATQCQETRIRLISQPTNSAEDRSGSVLSYLLLGPFRPIVSAALLIEQLAFLVAIPQNICVSIVMALSRDRESEADYIGMLLMTEAGFHPRGAVTVFRKPKYLHEKLKQLTPQRNAQKSELLSTHPHVSPFQVIVV